MLKVNGGVGSTVLKSGQRKPHGLLKKKMYLFLIEG